MSKPVILAVDDEPRVLSAVEADLRSRYGRDYQVVGAASGEEAREALRSLALRARPVALVMADQRMPGMTGVDLLREVRELAPDAKRALLTAYADTEAAIRAINEVALDHYLLKPWDPPEERLYPVVDDLLDEWWASYRPGAQGIRVVGHRWSREAHELKGFLARNQIPYTWLDIERDEEATRLLASAGTDTAAGPVVVLEDGQALVSPSAAELADRVGLHTRASLPFYDLVVVGGGPAGLAAGVYGSSEGLRTLVVERLAPGGQAGLSNLIENYLGFPKGLSGADLARRANAQALRLGAELLTSQEVAALYARDGFQVVQLSDGTELATNSCIVATGVAYRMLDVPGAEGVTGSGVYYGAGREEAQAHAGEDVFVLGGGNSAGQAAAYLSSFCASVTILVRGDGLAATMSRYLIDRLEATPNVALRPHAEVVEVHGGTRLEGLTIADRVTGDTDKIPAGALFVFIGMAPRTEWLPDEVRRDPGGFVLTGADIARDGRVWPLAREPMPLESSLPGLFAAGDVRSGSGKRVAVAVGEGAMAVRFVHEYLASR